MSVLLDTNILARIAQTKSPQRPVAQSAVDFLLRRGETLCIVPQVLYEFWVVCTRPIVIPHNGIGLTPDQAKTEMVNAQSLFAFQPAPPPSIRNGNGLSSCTRLKGRTPTTPDSSRR